MPKRNISILFYSRDMRLFNNWYCYMDRYKCNVQTDRHTCTQTDILALRQTHLHTDRHTCTQTDTLAHRQTHLHSDRHTCTQTDTLAHRQTHLHTDKQTQIYTTCIHVYIRTYMYRHTQIRGMRAVDEKLIFTK